ncbi:MAG TPA: tyrosine-type recombinase/integrase [Candidatus Bathyarchaeia archaeon]|nr:tyrosine-type recombinase/integrase [Candidatus Bathyarchaeia archaeon]
MRKKAPVTHRKYLGYITRFQNLTGLSPEQFLSKIKTLEPFEAQDLLDRSSTELKPSIQFCYTVALRSFLRHNGYNSLPKAELSYTPLTWHRAYKKSEVQKLLGYLPRKLHKLFVFLAVETGLRADTILELRYRHVMVDFETEIVPAAVRFEPCYHAGRKAAGYTFLGWKSVEMLRECMDERLIESSPDCRIVPRSYHAIYSAMYHAKREARLDSNIQPCHGFRKYFENALDQAKIDHDKKMIIEGHFAGTRAKHYTDRDLDELKELYVRAYPFIALTSENSEVNTDPRNLKNRVTKIESKLARQTIMEAKLIVLEHELQQLREVRYSESDPKSHCEKAHPS